MQESQKALLKYLSDALVCASSTSSSNTSSSAPAVENGNDRAGGVDARSIDTTASEPVDNSTIRDESLAQSVYSLIGTEDDAFYIISKNVQISYEQEQLSTVLRGIPYVVLKGLAAAIYYPDPLRRTLGDIDIIVRPEDFSRTYNALVNAGYQTNDPVEGDSRHVHFVMNGVTIELHRRYAELNSAEQEKLLDGWMFEAISNSVCEGHIEDQTFQMLPDLINGLVLLAHINQHLENGLGIRHILDWVMYVQRCLSDEKWPAFKPYSNQLGLTTLAVVAARIGQMYLHAYPDYSWCTGNNIQSGLSSEGRCVKGAEVDKLATALLEYCFDCGNFGAKLGQDNTVTMIMSHSKGVDGFFRNLQKRGEGNWKTLSTHPELRPFAWIYQAGRYVKRGLAAGVKVEDVVRDMDESKKRNQLMEQLGVKRQAVRDKDGE